jgi:ribosomal protein L37E
VGIQASECPTYLADPPWLLYAERIILRMEPDMNPTTFETADKYTDDIAKAVDEILRSPESEKLRNLLTEMHKAMGNRYSVTLDVRIEVFDCQKERNLPLLSMGLCAMEGKVPFPVSGDSSSHRYVVEGEIQVVPHDRCPRCWSEWDFKFKFPTCDHCGATMGKEVKLLLDSDVCPFCGDGTVTVSKPFCNQCGFKIDPSTVVWG